VLAGGHYAAEFEGGVEDIDPCNLLIQTMYRKATEYRLAHGREGRSNGNWNDFLSFSVLISSTGAGLLLFVDPTNDNLSAIAAVIAAGITGINAFSKFMDFSGKQERHNLSMKDFASLQRDLLTLLTATAADEVWDYLNELNSRFNEANNIMPVLDRRALAGVKDGDGNEMFQLIVEHAQIMEASADLAGGVPNAMTEHMLLVDSIDNPDDVGTNNTERFAATASQRAAAAAGHNGTAAANGTSGKVSADGSGVPQMGSAGETDLLVGGATSPMGGMDFGLSMLASCGNRAPSADCKSLNE